MKRSDCEWGGTLSRYVIRAIAIALVALCAWASWLFRYTPLTTTGDPIVLDRWTGVLWHAGTGGRPIRFEPK